MFKIKLTPALLAAGLTVALLAPTAAQAQDPATRTPGTPVPQQKAVSKVVANDKDEIRGDVPKTAVLGVPDPGTVPVIGDVKAKADDGAYVEYETKVMDGVVDLMVYSPALKGYAPVRVQLPPSWGTDPKRTYPTMYLLHGGGATSDYQSWSLYTDQHQTTKNVEALFVMPSGGETADFTNFWNYGKGAAQGRQWNTWLTQELPQILQRGYKANDRAAVTGISSSGRAALEAAMTRPDYFRAAGTMSGLPDTQLPGVTSALQYGKVIANTDPFIMWGHWLFQMPIWTAHNPAANLDKLKNVKLFSYVGGDPLPLESLPKFSTESFVKKANKAGISVQTSYDPKGSHWWPAWGQALKDGAPTFFEGLGLN